MSVRTLAVRLLKADPHRWGVGLVHQIDPENGDRLMCGKAPANCPGDPFDGRPDQVNCKLCLRAIEARDSYKQRENERRYNEAHRIEQQRLWWQSYNAYLLSNAWQTKRSLVMARAENICEGCGIRPALQVHHLRYPQQCWPGSEQWRAQEKLFDLRAVCGRCHNEIHQGRAA